MLIRYQVYSNLDIFCAPVTKLTATPNLPLNPDPAYLAFRSFSSSRLLGFAPRLGAGGAG